MNKKNTTNKPRTYALNFADNPSLTKQSFRDGTQIDNVLKKYTTLGISDLGLRLHNNVATMPFGIADTIHDYQYQLNRINTIKAYFASLPSGIRERFANDPANMLAFMADKRNFEAACDLGLFKRPDKPGDPNKPPTPPPAAPPATTTK